MIAVGGSACRSATRAARVYVRLRYAPDEASRRDSCANRFADRPGKGLEGRVPLFWTDGRGPTSCRDMDTRRISQVLQTGIDAIDLALQSLPMKVVYLTKRTAPTEACHLFDDDGEREFVEQQVRDRRSARPDSELGQSVRSIFHVPGIDLTIQMTAAWRNGDTEVIVHEHAHGEPCVDECQWIERESRERPRTK